MAQDQARWLELDLIHTGVRLWRVPNHAREIAARGRRSTACLRLPMSIVSFLGVNEKTGKTNSVFSSSSAHQVTLAYRCDEARTGSASRAS